jgi:hypothetical protein
MCKISIYKVVFDTLKLIFGIYLPRRQGGFEICYLLFELLTSKLTLLTDTILKVHSYSKYNKSSHRNR